MSRAPSDRTARPALVIADVDGTLVTTDKRLTPGAVAAVRRLDAAGVAFTLVSSRPPRGMEALVSELGLSRPFAAFNGGNLIAPDLTLLAAHRLTEDVTRRTLERLDRNGIGAWVFSAGDWRLRDLHGPNVERERRAVGFDPTVVVGFEADLEAVDKVVGVSNDHVLLARVEAEARVELGGAANVQLSQPYYLDITHPEANKGAAVRSLCGLIGVDPARTAVIGDMFNDVAMFGVAGLSIAMGQAPAAVRRAADVTTASNDEDGFARAIDRFILAAGLREAG